MPPWQQYFGMSGVAVSSAAFLLLSEHSDVSVVGLMLLVIQRTSCKKGKGLDTCYSATYVSQTRDQQHFTISEVAADWHEPIVPQRIMWPSIARTNGQLDPWCS